MDLKTEKPKKNNSWITPILLSMVVIIIILIFISLFSCIGCNTMNITPLKNTKILLQTQMNNPGAESCTDSVTFSRSNSQLSAEGITNNSGLNPDQVVFANPQEISNFEASNSLLKYGGTASKKVIMCIICAEGKSGLQQALIDNGVSTTINSTIEYQTLCVVYPKTNNLT